MFNLKRDTLGTAVHTSSLPFCQEILAHKIAVKLPVLVLFARYFRVLYLLSIKASDFYVDLADWQQGRHPSDGFDRCLRFGLQRRRQPSSIAASIRKTCRTVSRLSASPVATILPSLIQFLRDAGAQMDFCLQDDLFVGDSSDANDLRSGIDPNGHRLSVPGRLKLKLNRQRLTADHVSQPFA